MDASLDSSRVREWSLALALLLFLCIAGAAEADSVLILDPTVSGGLGSLEAQTATALGFTVNVVSAATWSTMTTAQFKAYRAIILGDPLCSSSGSTGPVFAATANASTWGSAVDGNLIVIGTDPADHASVGTAGAKLLNNKGIAFATAQPGRTGAYISLSCYYNSAPPGTPVPLLDGAFGSGPGSFQVRSPGCFNNSHLTATSPVLTSAPPLTDAALSNWNCSVHEAFDAWSLNFVVLAIAQNAGSSFTAPDGSVGSPYILARGDVSVLSDITLSPASATNEIGVSHTFTATVKSSTGAPLPGKTVTFKIIAGPNVGLTASAVTDTSGSATFTYASNKVGTDTIEAQVVDAAGKTETSNLAEKTWIETPKSCMRIFASQVLCETNSSGKPTGRYVWQFHFQNLSGKNVFHLFVVDLPSGVSVDQDHVVFSTGVPAGTNSPPIKVTFIGAKPGPLSFKLLMLDETLDECCTIAVTLDLPACDCAQIVGETLPSCFFPRTSPTGYSFSLQNLSSILAETIVIVPVSPADHLTPIPPDQLTVTKDVISIPPLGTGGKTATIPVSLSGPLAVGGNQVCLGIGVHDASLVNCCSLVRCFTLPDCRIRFDDFYPLGHARLQEIAAGLEITDIGSSGKDGAGVTPHAAQQLALEWLPLDAPGPLPSGAFFEMSAGGNAGETAGKLRVTESGANFQVSTDIGGAATYRVDVFNGGQPVGTAGQQPGINIIVIWPVGAGAAVVAPEPNEPGTLGFILQTDGAVPWRLADGSTLTGDRFRISPEQSPSTLGSLETFQLRAASIPSITVTGASASFDCNHNGIPDAEDIANGTSVDLNGNGVPDECENQGAADLDLPLNTGFDQATGTTMPPGASDGDWRVLNTDTPAQAKVVIHPVAAWPAPLAGSKWISVEANHGTSVPGLPILQFQSCFCIGAAATTAELDLQLWADDSATVLLNGAAIGGPGGSFKDASPLAIHFTGAVGGNGPLRGGENCLDVFVNDSGGSVTGLDLAGTVSAAHGSCAAAQASTAH